MSFNTCALGTTKVLVAKMDRKFVVKRKEAELISPARATPREIKLLSDIDDQQELRALCPVILLYERNPWMKGKDPVISLREALAEALVFYYPYAGRLVEGPDKKLMVDCTGEGVAFMEASADVRLEELSKVMLPPCPFSKEFLLEDPASSGLLGCPLITIQVTRLICGGFVLGILFNHVISDTVGVVQFLNAICQISKGSSSLSPLPVWRRELLISKDPPSLTLEHPEYEVVSKHCLNPEILAKTHVREPFLFGPHEIKAIKKHLPPHLQTCSTFFLIAAWIWRSRTRALCLDPEEDVSLVFVVSIRGKTFINLPSGYYGNSFVMPTATSKAKMLCDNSLAFAIELLYKARARVDADFVRSTMNFLVQYGRPGFSSKWKDLIVADASRVGMDKVDFGWGNPVYGGRMDVGNSPNMSILSRFKNEDAEGVVVVPLALPVEAMESFKAQFGALLPEGNFFPSNNVRIVSKL